MPLDQTKLISLQKARTLYQSYTDKNYKIINANRNTPDSRSYWYSVAEMQEYLDYIKSKFPESDFTQLGLRIYMGTYGVGDVIDGKNVTDYQTVFFYPMNSNQNILKNNLEEQEMEDDLGYNRGNLSPPF